MVRVIEFCLGIALIGFFAVAKFGLWDGMPGYLKQIRGEEPPAQPVNIWSKDYDPATAPPPVFYANCDAARAAGAAPMRRGAPGYRLDLDRDRDGTACEPWR